MIMAVTHNGTIIVDFNFFFYHWLNALYEHYNFYKKPKGGSATLILCNTVMFHLNIVKPNNRHKFNWTTVKWSLSFHLRQLSQSSLPVCIHLYFTAILWPQSAIVNWSDQCAGQADLALPLLLWDQSDLGFVWKHS